MFNRVFKRNNQKFVFIHIPKTAGMSVLNSLGFKFSLHRPIKYFFSYKTDSLYSFAFVRNPWDRVVSAYFYLINPENKFLMDRMFNYLFLRKFKGDFNKFVRKGLGKYPWLYMKYLHFKPQYKFISDTKGNIAIKFLGRYEKLDNDYNKISKIIAIDNSLPHINKSKHRNFRKYYNRKSIDTIRNLYKEDIKRFNYKYS